MKVLVVGSGGREHALCWRIAQEAEVIATPGNPGIEQVGSCFAANPLDLHAIVQLCQTHRPDLVLVGPEAPLIAGLADELRKEGFAVFGPGKAAAQLEGSKAFSKDLMKAAGVTTAEYEHFSDSQKAFDYAKSRFAAGRQVVVKASGEALGKGVLLCHSIEEARIAIDAMMVERVFGPAGDTIVVEDLLVGREFSLLTLCTDDGYRSLPVAQDYKRAGDGDEGLNTGGMGSYTPVNEISPDLVAETERTIVAPALAQMKANGVPYRGVLFSGVMVADGKPYCLEYNVRFGDPETQSVMPRMGKGFVEALLACAEGRSIPPFEVLSNAAVTVVLASRGYPGAYERGKAIQIGAVPEGVTVFHAGTKHSGQGIETSGGRVLGVTGVADDLARARELAYEGVDAIDFEGKTYRSDIAS